MRRKTLFISAAAFAIGIAIARTIRTCGGDEFHSDANGKKSDEIKQHKGSQNFELHKNNEKPSDYVDISRYPDCQGCKEEQESCPSYVGFEDSYSVKLPDYPDIRDTRWKRYTAKINDYEISFNYEPGFERVFPDEIPYCTDREALFMDDRGYTVHVEVLDDEMMFLEESLEEFMEAMDKCGILTSVKAIEGGSYKGFAYWSGPDPDVGNYTTGCQLKDKNRLVMLSCIGNSTPKMFKNVEIKRVQSKCRVR